MAPTPGTLSGCGAVTCVAFFVAGIVGLAVVEFLAVLYLLRRLRSISSRPSIPVSDLEIDGDENSISVRGKAWVAPCPDHVDLSKVIMRQIRKDKDKDKDGHRECSRRGEDTKDVLEIAPVRMQAMVKDETLFLTAADGTEEKISLEGCEVITISSGPGPNRKWGKKFPIKLHHRGRHLYRGFKTLLFFAESGYAKEAWCEAFRAMAGTDPSLSTWTLNTKREYKEYTCAAEENMPYLTKFYATDEARDLDVPQKDGPGGQSSEPSWTQKVTGRWKRLTRKVSFGKDHRESKLAHVVDEVLQGQEPCSQKHDEKDWKNKDTAVADEDHRDSVAETASQADPSFDPSIGFEGLANGEASASVNEENNSAPASTHKDKRESHEQGPATQTRAHEPKDGRAGKEIEQGVLCLNMIVARLYFDFNHNKRRLESVERFFQRLLGKIRAPSYIKSITIKELDLGRHPPFATAVRMLPSDAEGALAVEVDLQWLGGGHLTCETRLDLREQSAQEKVVNQLTDSGSERDAAAALLSGIRGEVDVSGSGNFSVAAQEERQLGDEGSNKKGRIMSMVSRVADRVSQVPLVLKIRLVALKGTAVFKLKAPPSDRLWFAFKTMPDVHFEPVPCIGEHRISSSALGNLIAKQIKIQIRESVVLPYCEDFFLDWMLADKNNWRPTSAFPFPFFDSQLSEAERKFFKRNAEIQSSSSDENGRPGQVSHPPSQSIHNGQSKPPKGEASQGAFKAQARAPSSQANNFQPRTSSRVPKDGLLHPRRSSSDHVMSSLSSSKKPPRSASTDRLNAQSSVPKPPKPFSKAGSLSAMLSAPVQATGPTALSLTSPLISKEKVPLFITYESHKEEDLGSAGDSEAGISRMATDARSKNVSLLSEGSHKEEDLRAVGCSEPGISRMATGSSSKDFSLHSEGSASESDVQFLATQVAKPEGVQEPVHVVPLRKRARLRMMGARLLDEGRRNVVEKLHHKKQDDSDGSAHSQPSGRWAHESPSA